MSLPANNNTGPSFQADVIITKYVLHHFVHVLACSPTEFPMSPVPDWGHRCPSSRGTRRDGRRACAQCLPWATPTPCWPWPTTLVWSPRSWSWESVSPSFTGRRCSSMFLDHRISGFSNFQTSFTKKSHMEYVTEDVLRLSCNLWWTFAIVLTNLSSWS